MKILEQIIKTTKLSHKNFALPNIFLLCSLLRRRGTLEAFNNFYYFFKKRNLFCLSKFCKFHKFSLVFCILRIFVISNTKKFDMRTSSFPIKAFTS